MDALSSLLPGWVILLLGLFLIGLLVSVVVFLIKVGVVAGVVIKESRKPPHIDAGDYRLAQGREVRAEGSRAAVSDEGQARPAGEP